MARGNARSSAGGRISGGKPPYSPSPSVQGCAPAARMRIASAGGCCSECSRAQLPVRQRQLPCDRSAAGARQRGWRGSRAGGGREARLLAEAVTAQQLAATERSPGRWRVQLLPPRVRGHWSTDIHRGCDGLGPCGRVSSVSARRQPVGYRVVNAPPTPSVHRRFIPVGSTLRHPPLRAARPFGHNTESCL